ncbi:hypothetical protein FHETE_2152 [Fusarium heterosporum]|uniref:Uncharacterized protein n=1 Tax=Fusarium heterosporum TaxID=42747 RepID=A0A8H5WZZ7_FUSHE|nr:hypothetical protein FHETE_2152 [Fusarium heterosporum]
MASNNPSASCVEPPPDVLAEKPSQQIPLIKKEAQQLGSCPFSSSPSNVKSFTPRTRQALENYLCSSNSGLVSSVDLHTPPPKPRKPKQETERERELKRKWKIEAKKPIKDVPEQVHKSQFEGPPAGGHQPFELRETWHFGYPHPCNEHWPAEDEFNFTPRVIAEPIDPELPLFAFELESDVHFLEPLSVQGAIRNEYAAHLADGEERHEMRLNKMNNSRRIAAEIQASENFDFNETTKPIEHGKVSQKVQRAIYDDKVDLSGLTRKIAICDGTIAGIIAGEFTYRPDYANLPPTEHQMAVLREAESLQGLFPQKKPAKSDEFAPVKNLSATQRTLASNGSGVSHDSTPKPSLYDEWVKKQSSNACPASGWLKEEERFAKKKAFEEAFSKQIEPRFPTPKSFKVEETVKNNKSEELKWATDYFPYLPPKTITDLERPNMYDAPLKVDVPKWFPAFTDSGVVPLSKHNSTDKQYQELLTNVWRLESQILNNKNKPDKWDKKWHEPSTRWAEPFQQTGDEQFDTYEKTKPRDLLERDLVAGEFSFEDVFDMEDGGNVSGKKRPEVLLFEIEHGVKKAIAKVGM